MGILSRLAAPAPEARRFGASWSVGDDAAWSALFGSQDSAAGPAVTHDTALSVSAVYQAVRLIAETLATAPLKVYRDNGRSKEPARDHPLWRVLHDEPNTEQTAVEAREMLIAWAALTGTGYAHIVRDGAGRPRELWPVPSHRVTPRRDEAGELYYVVSVAGEQKPVAAANMLALRGFGLNGVLGEDPVARMREAFGLSMATEQFGASFFGRGTTISGAISHPGTLSPEARTHLREQLERQHSGLTKSHRLMLLQEGMKFEPGGITPEQGQMLETRRFQVLEVARAFNIQPHLLMDLERATFSNIESQFIQFVTVSLRPWAVRLEQACHKRLLSQTEKATHHIAHNLEGLLRGDSASRAAFYNQLFNLGAISPNEIREKEELGPVDGGDERYRPLNMVPLGEDVEPEALRLRATPAPELRDVATPEVRSRLSRQRQRSREAFRPLLHDTAHRWIRRQVEATRAAVRRTMRQRDTTSLREWLERWYGEDQPGYIRDQLRPVLLALATDVGQIAAGAYGSTDLPDVAELVDTMTRQIAGRETDAALAQLLAILRDAPLDELADELEQRLADWEADGADRFAGRAVVEASEGVSRHVWAALGAVGLVWRASADACPLCASLDGRRASIDSAFLGAGEQLSAEGAAPLTPRRAVMTPPLHAGCTCELFPD